MLMYVCAYSHARSPCDRNGDRCFHRTGRGWCPRRNFRNVRSVAVHAGGCTTVANGRSAIWKSTASDGAVMSPAAVRVR